MVFRASQYNLRVISGLVFRAALTLLQLARYLLDCRNQNHQECQTLRGKVS